MSEEQSNIWLPAKKKRTLLMSEVAFTSETQHSKSMVSAETLCCAYRWRTEVFNLYGDGSESWFS